MALAGLLAMATSKPSACAVAAETPDDGVVGGTSSKPSDLLRRLRTLDAALVRKP
jgi:hypothetical protein